MSHKLARKTPNAAAVRVIYWLFFFLFISQLGVHARSSEANVEPDIFGKCWEYKASTSLGAGIAADESNAYFVDDENKLHAVDLAVGGKSWTSELGGTVVSNILLVQRSLYVVTNSQPDVSQAASKSTLRALSRQTGITEWASEIASSSVVWIGAGKETIVTVGSEGSVLALTRRDGKLAWRTGLESQVTAIPFFHENGIEIATGKNEVVKVASDGSTRVGWKSEYLPTAVVLDGRGRLLIGDERGNFTAISADGDRLWAFRNGAQISSATTYSSEYLATSFDNFVYRISRSGNVRWKRRLSGRVNDRPLLIGRAAVISIIGAGSVYVLDLKTGKVSNRIEMGDEMTVQIAAPVGGQGFLVAAPGGISYFTTAKCLPNKKTEP